jgi:hypothetical protein
MVIEIELLESPDLTVLNFCVVGLDEERRLHKKGG